MRALKEQLVQLGYLARCTHDRFLGDTRRAVLALQRDCGLEADGLVGPGTREAIEGLLKAAKDGNTAEPADGLDLVPDTLPAALRAAIGTALAGVDEVRVRVVRRALAHAVEAEGTAPPLCFYIRGANLYDTDLSLHAMTEKRLKAYFHKAAYRQYFDGGRQEMMAARAREAGYAIPGADCSGMVVGLWRAEGLVKPGFDACADSLFSRYCTAVESPEPGDLCWRKGHIGLYVGGGYVAECLGGAYGLVLTRLAKRRARSRVDGSLHSFSAWQGYGRPKCYGGR